MTTVMNHTLMRRSVIAAVLLATAMLAPAASLYGQSTPNQLYFAVQSAQLDLGNGAAADQLRDQFLIRELETESARGFTADLSVLEGAAEIYDNADIPVVLEPVQQALLQQIAAMRRAANVEVIKAVSNLDTELVEVDFEALENSRTETLEALEAMDDINILELSKYGRYHLNKNLLDYAETFRELEDFDFRVTDIDPDAFLPRDDETDEEYQKRLADLDSGGQTEFNRKLNTLRKELVAARQRFGLAWLSYQNPAIAIAERKLYRMEKQVAAYLMYQSRRRPAIEEQLKSRKQAFVSADGQAVDTLNRLYQAELGRWIGFLSVRDQADGLDSAARRDFSRPNFMVTIQESLANRVAGQGLSQMDYVDEVIVGSRAQGWSYTNGAVNLDFVDSPYSGMVRIGLAGSIQSSTYTKEGPVTAYTNSTGGFSADRNVLANIGNLSVYSPNAWADISTTFLGTNCAPFVTRLANRRFSERQMRAQEIASERARVRVLDQFTTQTNEALEKGAKRLSETRDQREDTVDFFKDLRKNISEEFAKNEAGEIQRPFDLIDPFVLPRLFVTSSDSQLRVAGILEGENRLAAPNNPPAKTVPVDVRVQIHESMLSNFLAPFLQNRLLENWKIRNTVESLVGDNVNLPAQTDDRPFGIRFEDGRPIQFEFAGNELGVTIFGKEFRQGETSYADPLNINIRFRLINDNGELKVIRSAKAVTAFTYDPLPGKSLDVGFKSFLQDNLDKAMSNDAMENAISLPPNLIPLDRIEDEDLRGQIANAKLTELSMENGWLTMGWSYVEPGEPAPKTYTPAIWNETPEAAAAAEEKGELQ